MSESVTMMNISGWTKKDGYIKMIWQKVNAFRAPRSVNLTLVI